MPEPRTGENAGAVKSGGIVPADNRTATRGHWPLVSSAASLVALAGKSPLNIQKYKVDRISIESRCRTGFSSSSCAVVENCDWIFLMPSRKFCMRAPSLRSCCWGEDTAGSAMFRTAGAQCQDTHWGGHARAWRGCGRHGNGGGGACCEVPDGGGRKAPTYGGNGKEMQPYRHTALPSIRITVKAPCNNVSQPTAASRSANPP